MLTSGLPIAKLAEVKWIRSGDNLADAITKAKPVPKLLKP